VVNKIDITITNEKLNLLNKGIKYNLDQKHKHWIRNLACEAESAIALLSSSEQEHMRVQVAQNIKKLQINNINNKHTLPQKLKKS